MPVGKYGNKKVTVDGVKYDSKHEYKTHLWLQRKYPDHEIILQKRFLLLEGYKGLDGKYVRPTTYIADFYIPALNLVFDAKGAVTQVARIKQKMFGLMHRNLQLIFLYAKDIK